MSEQFSGLWGAARSYHFCIKRDERTPAVAVCADEAEYIRIRNELEFFAGRGNVLNFPQYTQDAFEHARILPQTMAERSLALNALASNQPKILVTTAYSLMKKLPEKSVYREAVIELEKGGEYSPDELSEKLLKAGYVNAEIVTGLGEFAFRGDTAEIFPAGFTSPVRLEFFDIELEDISLIDEDTRKRTERLDKVQILPMSELIADMEELSVFAPDEEVRDKLDLYGRYAGYQWLAPFVYDEMVSLLDWSAKNSRTVMFHDEWQEIFRRCEQTTEDKAHGLSEKYLENYSGADELIKTLEKQGVELYSDISSAPKAEGYKSIKDLFAYQKNNLYQSLKGALEAFNSLRGNRIILFIDSRKLSGALINFMQDYGFAAVNCESIDEVTEKDTLYICQKKATGGFLDKNAGICVICDDEIFGQMKKTKSRPKKESYGTSLSDLEPDDYVVHVDYGIGIYRGLEHKDIGGVEGDFLKIEYEGAEILYVPLESVGHIQKYIGTGASRPSLNSLKSASWKKVKQQASKRAKKIAIDLLKLYADRKLEKGISFIDDGELVSSFEQSFGYDETEDQLTAIADVYENMEDTAPMERLICGDVGFGKTEIAMRAACKAAACGRQVAVLAPTTVLVRQHYETFSKRFKPLGINIDYVSRMKSASQIKKTARELAEGKTDIIIGTHRLLSKDIEFKDLGLLIIDEEQRFGVAHKESIKNLKRNLDVLHMSATPIPRTLQLSLSGIRDISTIETPPEDRLPVITNIIRKDGEIKEAILKELERGGQVYFLHNRVQDIQLEAERVKNLVPHARIDVSHGQMTATAMEKSLGKFYSGETDILISTTIIENGLDIPNANTIIINNAATFGLAQIYQLKGRVGRSSKRGYCYLVVPSMSALSDVARKRMKIIQQLGELGSGVKIAFYDLQLRGAGDLLGADQSGYVVKVGYELFIQLIDEAVRELKGEALISDAEIISSLPYYIPADYVEDMRERFDYYRRFGRIETFQMMNSLLSELEETYGELKSEVRNLGLIMLIKNLASRAGVSKITMMEKSAKITFSKDAKLDAAKILTAVNDLKLTSKFQGEYTLVLMFAETGISARRTAEFFNELQPSETVS